MTTGVICIHAWLVTRIKNLDSVHVDRLTELLRRLEPVGGIEAYIQALGFMPWGRKFKLCHDDTILRNFMTLPPRDIDFLPCHFAAEATVRGNGPNTRNFGDPLDALIDEGKWPFRLSFAINNAVLRSGNFCELLRSDTPPHLASLCIHATSRCIGVANQQVDSNMQPYGRELMLAMDDIVRVALIIASGLNQLRCMLSTCFHISMLTWLVHELKHATFT